MTANRESWSEPSEEAGRVKETSPKHDAKGADEKPDITEVFRSVLGSDSTGKEKYPGLEKFLWDWHAQNQTKPATKRQEDVSVPSRVWWIEDPETLPLTDPSHLCDVCRHIDFGFLLSNSRSQQIKELVPLSSLEQIVQKKQCAFCRLLVYTIQTAFGEEELPFEIDAKPVTCQLRVLPMETNTSGPRQLCIYLNTRLKGKSIEPSTDLLIYAMSDEHTESGETPKQKSISMGQISLGMIKHWCSTCLDGKCGGTPFESLRVNLPKEFRLIDVELMCIVGGDNDFRYLALSYVWGHGKTFRNTEDLRRDLEVEGGLSKRLEELPETIKDAMDLVRELGERYLWVDSLCIIQDNNQDKADQITAMDVIYESALLTIAATSGDSVDAGLAGGQTKRRAFTQVVEKIQGLSLANRPVTFDKTIGDSSWNTRAWTFQERILSSRVLYVADQRCFFTCRHRPDAFMKSVDDNESSLIAKPLPTLLSDYSRNFIPRSQAVNVLSYSRTVRDYTSRYLTYASDILNAFEGVAARFRPLFRSDMLFGIPRSELDSQILWQADGPMTRRRDHETGLPLFPSWSWAGWVGKVRCNTHENLSRINWVDDDGRKFSSRDCRYPKGANQDPAKRIIYRCEWKGALANGLPYYWEVKNPDHYFLHPTAPEDQRTIGPHPQKDTSHIVFEAEATAAFNMGRAHYLTMAPYMHKCTPDTHTVCPLPLRDRDGSIAGSVLVPGDVSTTMTGEARYETVRISRAKLVAREDRGDGDPDLRGDGDAATLEENYFPDAPDVDRSRSGYGFDEQRFDGGKAWCLYNVMLVEMKEGVAYRLGVGTVHIDAWAQAKPEKKIVVLG